MIQMFIGILCLIAVGALGFGAGVADEIIDPTPPSHRSQYDEKMKSLCFWGMILMMIAAGLLLGYK